MLYNISCLENEDYDKLVLTEDYLCSNSYIDQFTHFLKKLNLQKPAFVITGDNDYKVSLDLWQDIFQEAGIRFLDNQGSNLNIDGNTINIIGVECPCIADNLDKSINNLNIDEFYNIILSHTYEILDLVTEEKNIDIIIVGDTHRGQIRLFIIGRKLINYIFWFDFLKGLYQLKGRVVENAL